jgi:hypothetical protein
MHIYVVFNTAKKFVRKILQNVNGKRDTNRIHEKNALKKITEISVFHFEIMFKGIVSRDWGGLLRVLLD